MAQKTHPNRRKIPTNLVLTVEAREILVREAKKRGLSKSAFFEQWLREQKNAEGK